MQIYPEPPGVPVKSVRCGLGRFSIWSDDTITQYDHVGRCVGVLVGSKHPGLRAMILDRPLNFKDRWVPPHGTPLPSSVSEGEG